MNVASIGQNFSSSISKVGQKLADGKMTKLNKFFETDGYNMGPAAFNTLLLTAVIVPRLIQARDADERREILTRDSVTVLTLLFALKGAKAGLSKIASKSNGLVLTNKNLPEGNFFKKAFDFIKPSGISALTSEQVTSKYGQVTNKEELVKLVKYLGGNGGDASKVLGMKDLSEATTKAIGDVKGKTTEEIAKLVEGTSEEQLKPLIDKLSPVNNPLTKVGKHVNAWLEAGSYATIISFLGFGLPAINKMITHKTHQKNNDKNQTPLAQPVLNAKYTQAEKETFKQFLA